MPVKILKSKNGNIFEPTKRAGLFCLAVEEIPADTGTSRNIKLAGDQSRRVAFIFRTKDQFDAIFKAMAIIPAEGTVLEGIVAVKEQMEPFSITNPMNGIKYPNAAAKAAGLMCTVAGKPVYRDTFYTTSENTDDILIPHENQNEIDAFALELQENFIRKINKESTFKKVKILPNWHGNGIYTRTKNYNTNGKLLSLGVMEIITESRHISGCCLGGVGRYRDAMTIHGIRVAYFMATQAKFDEIFKNEGIAPVSGTELPGCVTIEEGCIPLIASNRNFGLKFLNAECKAANIPCRVNGQPIYRNYTYVTEEKEDVLLEHDNQNEIDAVLSTRNRRRYIDDNRMPYVDDKISYPDGYGGYLDDDFIDDALGGEPDAYWNLD